MELGDIFRRKGGEANLAKAATYYERAARRGDREAPYWLGAMCEAEPRAAAKWYEVAAERGNRKAQSKLAEMYRAGEGVERDLVVAAFWEMAASAVEATYGVVHYKKLFAQFVLKAANQGHAEAQYRIARMLHEGDGVAKDEAAAALWMRKAAEHGHEIAALIAAS